MPNFAIRYPEGEDDKDFTPGNNYGAWAPISPLKYWSLRARDHQYIPRDYA